MATDGHNLGVLAGERPGLHADPKNGGAFALFDLDKADNVDAR